MRRARFLAGLANPRFDPMRTRLRSSGVAPGPGLPLLPPRADLRRARRRLPQPSPLPDIPDPGPPSPPPPPPVPFNRLVYDPVTEADIEVGSELFRRRTEPLNETSVAPFVYHPGVNEFAMQWTAEFMIVLAIEYDGDTAAREIELPVPDLNTQLIILRMIDELSVRPVNAPAVRALLDQLRMIMLEFSHEPFIAANFVEFQYQNVVVNVAGMNIAGADVNPVQGAVLGFDQTPLGANYSLRLPFTNIDSNDGVDGECVDRFLRMDLSRSPDLRNVNGMIDLANTYKFNLTLYDVLSGVMASVSVPEVDEDGFMVPHFRGLVFDSHVYPIEGNEAPQLMRRPVKRHDNTMEVLEMLENMGSAVFVVNDAFYVPNYGIVRPATMFFEDWMAPMLDLLPQGQGWDPTTMTIVKKSCMALQYNAPSVEDGLNPVEHVAFDVSKCYFHMLLHALDPANRVSIGRPSIFDRFHPVKDQEVRKSFYYKVEIDPPWQQRLGILTDVVKGYMIMLLRYHGISCTTTHVLKFEVYSAIGEKTRRKAHDLALSWTTDQRKKYAIVNGIMGKIKSRRRVQFKVKNQFEADYYVNRYGATMSGSTIMVEQETLDLVNRLHWHAHVIHQANLIVLDRALTIFKATGAWPVKIKVDSLTYRRLDLRTPWTVDGEQRLREFFQTPSLNAPWHAEPIGPPGQFSAAPMYRRLLLHETETYDNTTYIGPPGTGKTYSALNNHDIDLAVCYSNKGARRVNGRTIHSALGLWGDKGVPSMDQLRDKTVFIDEFQSVPRTLIAYCMRAYHEVGTRFIFAMDLNQLPPVRELPLPVDGTPFMGTKVYLTTEHRNDAELVVARRELLIRKFTPSRLEPVTVDADGKVDFTVPDGAMCIAYLRETCRIVNEKLVKQMGIQFGDPRGRYIGLETNRRYGVLKSEILTRRAGLWIRSDGTTFECPPDRASKFIGWGFCVTIHKMIGETVEGPLAIFDWTHILVNVRTKYTAITRARRLRDITFYPAFPKPTKPD